MPAHPFDLTGRVAVLTGAAGHLGASLARALAQAGAQVVLTGRRVAPLRALARELGPLGLAQSLDVRSAASVERLVRTLTRRTGRVDILVNNAYAGGGGRVDEASAGEFAQAYDVAVIGAFRLAQALHSLLAAAGGGSVINIASMYGLVSPDPRIYRDGLKANPAFYGAAKAGLLQFTRHLACEWAPDGIRVNAISPGPFPAPAVQQAHPAFIRRLAEKVPLGRVGKPEELGGAVVFLASDAASFVTGSNLVVDGGWTAW